MPTKAKSKSKLKNVKKYWSLWNLLQRPKLLKNI